MSEWIEYNINNHVRVKLTDKGKDIYYHQHDEHNKRMGEYGMDPIKPSYPKINKDGYYETQMHQLMYVFGESLSMGSVLPFDSNVYIEEIK